MKKLLVGAGLCLLLLFMSQGDASAQNLVPNGGFEQQALGRWDQHGQNGSSLITEYDVSGNGVSWCWKRQPADGHHGGIKQTVTLLGGVAYNVSMDLAFLCQC
jgi:hypothetical protein